MLGLVAAGVVAAGLVATALLVVTRGPSPLAAEDAARSLDEIVDAADLDRDDDVEVGVAEPRDCPLGDLRDLEGAVEEAVGDLPRLRDRYQEAFGAYEGSEAGVLCAAAEDGDGPVASVLVVATYAPSGDYAEVLEELYVGDDVTTEEPVGHRGGLLHPYCVEQVDDAGYGDGCGADWIADDHDLLVGLYVTELDIDADAAADLLRSLLPDLLDALAEAEPEFEE